MFNYTKAPWRVTDDSNGKYVTIKGDDGKGRTVARIPWNAPNTPDHELTDGDDAHLIKASPDLLAACETIEKFFTSSPCILWPDLEMGKSRLADIVEAAIKRAKGGI